MSDKSQGGGPRRGTDDAGGDDHRRNCLLRRFHPVYDPSELTRIHEIRASSSHSMEAPDDNPWDAAPTSLNLTSEDAHRLRVLERIASDRRWHQRRSIVGSSAMAQRIETLSAAMPHFAPAIDLVARAVLVSARPAMPLRLPPILLLGEPGLGKSSTRCAASRRPSAPTSR